LVSIATVVAVEGLAGFIINSLALLSDAAHALFDVIATLILLLTTRWSLKPPDDEHMYGHGKIESLGGLLGGVALLALVVVLSAQAAMRLLTGENPVRPELIGFGAIFFTFTVDIFRIGILQRAEKSITVRADLFHAFSDFASTLVALIGLAAAGAGLYLGDSVASLALSIFLAYLSARLIHEAGSELTDAIPREVVHRIRSEIERTRGVSECRELKARRVGTRTYVDTVVSVPHHMSIEEAHVIATRIESRLSSKFHDSVVTVHLEPVQDRIPLSTKVENLCSSVEEVRRAHRIDISETEKGLYITLHIEVDPGIPLDRAHGIAQTVEEKIRQEIEDVEHVTVHIEAFGTEPRNGIVVHDTSITEKVRKIVALHNRNVEASRVITYSTEGTLHINVECLVGGKRSVEKTHRTLSEIEEDLHREFEGSIVTVHPEPFKRKAEGENPTHTEQGEQ